MKSFQQYMDLSKTSSKFTIDESWAQGRSVFGGLSAALLLAYIEANTDFTDRELRSVNVQFCSALIANELLELNYEILSSGKSITHIQAKLTQDNAIKTIINCCFANERTSNIDVPTPKTNITHHLDVAQKFPFIKGIVPDFVQHIDMRLNSGNMPFSGSKNKPIEGWMHFEHPPSEFSDCAILALIDAWPPAVLPLLTRPAPASSVTWNVEFIHPRTPLSPQEHLYYECEVVQASAGLAHTEARIHSYSGELIALSRQVVAVYDQR